MSFTASIRTASLAVAAALAALPAAAASRVEAPAIHRVQAAQPTQGELEAFVAATVRIVDIQRQTEAQLQDTSDAEQVAMLEQQAQTAMATAVTEEGLTVEQYNAIVQQAQTDPELSRTIEEMLPE